MVFSGAEQGPTGLLGAAQNLGQQLFDVDNPNSEYSQRGRTDEQFAADISFAYLQRAPETNIRLTLGNTSVSRASLRDQMGSAENAEFGAIASTLYGSNDGSSADRVTRYLTAMYPGVPRNGGDFESDRETLETAAAEGRDAVIASAKAIGTSIFQGWVDDDKSVSDEEFAASLFHAFLQREASASEVSDWVDAIQSKGRGGALQSFTNLPATEELAGTLYHGLLWLTPDHLGTPRIISERSGSLAGIKRHDYLPFGEELVTGGRTTAQGYSIADDVRQKFTQKERDDETGLDYSINRYYSSTQGRFTSPDPISGRPGSPQSWNRYTYSMNNPLKYVDPRVGLPS